MTTQTRNEAAERLLLTLTTRGLFSSTRVQEMILRQVDKALAAERRATVERIRERLYSLPLSSNDVAAILDEEAAS